MKLIRTVIIISLLSLSPLYSQTTLSFMLWGNNSRFNAIENAISLYESKHEDIKINLITGSYTDIHRRLTIMMRNGELPDIFAYDYKWTNEINTAHFSDLADIVDHNQIPKDIIENYSVKDDHVIGIPLGLNGIGMIYNTEFFETFELKDPSSWDWDDIIEIGSRVHRANSDCYLLFFPETQWHYFVRTYILQQSGHHIIRDDGTIECTKEDLESVFSFILKMIDSGTIPPFGLGTLYENWLPQYNYMWQSGRWGMTSASSSTIQSIASESQFPVSSFPYPVPYDSVDKGVYAAPTMLLSINAASENKEIAGNFISFIINDKDASMLLSDSFGMSANTALISDKDGLVTPIVQNALENASLSIYPAEISDEILEIINEYVHLVGFKILSAEEAAAAMLQRLTDYSQQKTRRIAF